VALVLTPRMIRKVEVGATGINDKTPHIFSLTGERGQDNGNDFVLNYLPFEMFPTEEDKMLSTRCRFCRIEGAELVKMDVHIAPRIRLRRDGIVLRI